MLFTCLESIRGYQFFAISAVESDPLLLTLVTADVDSGAAKIPKYLIYIPVLGRIGGDSQACELGRHAKGQLDSPTIPRYRAGEIAEEVRSEIGVVRADEVIGLLMPRPGRYVRNLVGW